MYIYSINMELINEVFHRSVQENEDLVTEILSINSDKVDVLSEDERAFPGNKNFLESGYYKTMLKRYFFAGEYFSKGKEVLDTCCGLGWGTKILSNYAREITAFDLDFRVIDFCKETWKADNINWKQGNSLDLRFLKNKKFDIVLGMETIEHFSMLEGEKYVYQISTVLKKDGIFIATSYFPNSRAEAEKVCKNNPYHKYIFTFDEMNRVLDKYLSKHIIVNNWMVIAVK